MDKKKDLPEKSRKCERWCSEENLQRIEDWAALGLTREDIAHNMGITRKALYNWCLRSPEIYEAIERGKEPADEIVESNLYKAANGYDYEEKIKTFDKDGELVELKVYEKKATPNVKAAVWWLRNRQPDKWRQNPEPTKVEITGDDGFYKALSGTAVDDWIDEDDEGEDSEA
jgi:transcriptional regulator with XRE-family HTH domain